MSNPQPLLWLLFVLGLAGCSQTSPVLSWPQNGHLVSLPEQLGVNQNRIRHYPPVSLMLFRLGSDVDELSWRLVDPIKISDPQLAGEVVERIYSVGYERRPMFTLLRPIYAIAVDQNGVPVGACRLNDGYLQPIAVWRDCGVWKTRDFFTGELKHHAMAARNLESHLRQCLETD